MLLLLLFKLLFSAAIVQHIDGEKTKVVCYFANTYGISASPPEMLDPNLCTHIIYAFVQVGLNGEMIIDNKAVDINKEMYKRVLALKNKNPNLKVLISIGNTVASTFSHVASNSTITHNFVKNAVNFLKEKHFDGLDIDWEKPAANDTENFVDLLRKMKKSLENEGLLLTIAVYPNPSSGYNTTEVVKYVDMLLLMCYNYYGPWSPYTGHNSPLFKSKKESIYEQRNLNIASSLANWIEAGAPKDKIVIGIPFYGRTFTLVNPDDNGYHAPTIGAGKPATASYRTICTSFENYTAIWDDEQKVHYKFKDDQWLTYEEEKSIHEKIKYVVSQTVAGIMIWQIGQDDVKGECGKKQILLQVINEYLNSIKIK